MFAGFRDTLVSCGKHGVSTGSVPGPRIHSVSLSLKGRCTAWQHSTASLHHLGRLLWVTTTNAGRHYWVQQFAASAQLAGQMTTSRGFSCDIMFWCFGPTSACEGHIWQSGRGRNPRTSSDLHCIPELPWSRRLVLGPLHTKPVQGTGGKTPSRSAVGCGHQGVMRWEGRRRTRMQVTDGGKEPGPWLSDLQVLGDSFRVVTTPVIMWIRSCPGICLSAADSCHMSSVTILALE